jgi:hypothetical protein
MSLGIFAYTPAKNVSGVKKIFLAEKSAITAITVTTGEISAVTGTTPFMKTDIIPDSGSWEEKTEKVGKTNHKISNLIKLMVMPPAKATNTWKQSLVDASPGGLLALVVDDNNKCFIVGYSADDLFDRPLILNAIDQKTGSGISDDSGNTVNVELGNDCLGFAIPLDATLTAAVLAGNSTICKWS